MLKNQWEKATAIQIVHVGGKISLILGHVLSVAIFSREMVGMGLMLITNQSMKKIQVNLMMTGGEGCVVTIKEKDNCFLNHFK